MTGFLDDDALLSGELARTLFHEVAEGAPIVDLHTHLSAADIAADRVYESLTDLWLAGDHYKWRAMRLAGHDEVLVTGDADPWDKFQAWAATVPRLVRNPLYLWTHLELRRVFGIDLHLGPSTAREIWEEANRLLPEWSVKRLLARFGVQVLATTEDPGDDLTPQRALRSERAEAGLVVVPTLRPDAAHDLLDDPVAWNRWADRLAAASGQLVEDRDSLLAALAAGFERFADLGSWVSDHGLGRLPDEDPDPEMADAVLRRARQGAGASPKERDVVALEVVRFAARLAITHDSVLQLHLGPRRDVSPRLRALVGRDAGADVIDDARQAPGLARFLGGLDAAGSLPRTVLYNLNPADNVLFAAMAGAFARPGVASVVQWGPPWWFNDHETGMRRHLDDLSDVGQLASFVGMVTDSRSPLSMTRHEVFRRVLCDAIGRDVEAGRVPADLDALAKVVRDVCVDNARRFFTLPTE